MFFDFFPLPVVIIGVVIAYIFSVSVWNHFMEDINFEEEKMRRKKLKWEKEDRVYSSDKVVRIINKN